MAMCKPDLVAGVLKQLGYEVPDAKTLTNAVFEASAELKKESGLDVADCLLLAPVQARRYSGGVREAAESLRGRETIYV
jgi:predicted nucleic acid-binding protein